MAIGGRAIIAAAAFLVGIAAPALAETRPVVVELFTSQGCSSCPPADALLGELARRPDVIALGYHIDYWDGLGWKDPLSSPEATARQRNYARQFGHGQVYTPQIVIDGTDEAIGSDRSAVNSLLKQAKSEAIAPVMFAENGRKVAVGAGHGNGKILLVRLARQRTTRVDAGENAHRTLADANGVEALTVLGEWQGTMVDFPVEPPSPGEGLAVLVQAPDGRVLGAASLFAPG
jgi:hypothetical protein